VEKAFDEVVDRAGGDRVAPVECSATPAGTSGCVGVDAVHEHHAAGRARVDGTAHEHFEIDIPN
jgi:hypothetical protein